MPKLLNQHMLPTLWHREKRDFFRKQKTWEFRLWIEGSLTPISEVTTKIKSVQFHCKVCFLIYMYYRSLNLTSYQDNASWHLHATILSWYFEGHCKCIKFRIFWAGVLINNHAELISCCILLKDSFMQDTSNWECMNPLSAATTTVIFPM